MAHCQTASFPENACSLVEIVSSGLVAESLGEASKAEKIRVRTMILNKMCNLNISKIEKVQSSFLEAMYLLKKEEYKRHYGQVNEVLLFHVTAASSVKSIIKNNFDWRRVCRGKFGIGTSFSNDPRYANRFANEDIGSDRAFIITKVLISNKVRGRYMQRIPNLKYDTTTGNNKVFVKFCDNEFLPVFIAYFTVDTYVPASLFDDYSSDSDDYYYF